MIAFSWRVPRGGYRWVRADGDDLVEVLGDAPLGTGLDAILLPVTDGRFRERVPGASQEGRELFAVTNPLAEHTGLFREFAGTTRTRSAIKAFADRYGNLGSEFDVLGLLEGVEPPEPDEHLTGEEYAAWRRTEAAEYRVADTHGRWHREISRMAKALAAWDKSRGRDDRQVPEGVRQAVNNALAEHRVGASLEPVAKKKQVRLHLAPSNLIGALWSQFAEAVSGNKDYRACDRCGEWFEMTPGTARTNRRFCGDRPPVDAGHPPRVRRGATVWPRVLRAACP